MGYTTDFEGTFKLSPALNPEQIAYLNAFADTRRMMRDSDKCEKFSDTLRQAVGLPVGHQGEYCVFSHDKGFMGQDKDETVIEYNESPNNQPGLWCKWVPTEDGKFIKWNGAEKFYYYIEWINYINDNFLKRWGITINGNVKWYGEEREDVGTIYAKNGVIYTSEDNDVQVEQGNVFEGEFEEVKDFPRLNK